MVPVRLNRKSILKSLGSRENALKSYISDKRLNLKNPEDVVNLISYYNAQATTH
jgi:hypothetical protein